MANTRGSAAARRRARPAAGGAAALAAALLLMLGAAMALGAARAGRYSGTTSEHGAVTLKIASGKVTHFHAELGYNGKCGQGGGPVLTAAPASIAIHGGHFTANVRLRLKTVVNDPGIVEGRASGSRVSGTIAELLNGQRNKCYVETFSARRVGS
jgi:hypothetical protein